MVGKGLDCLFPIYRPVDGYSEKLRVRCGSCFNCKMFRRQEWCLRLQMESKYWTNMCFVTLTYDDEHLPINEVSSYVFEDSTTGEEVFLRFPTLADSHLRNFIKQLRNFEAGEIHDFGENRDGKRRVYRGLRYFAVGEYGTRRGRPHYHLMLFGVGCSSKEVQLISKAWDNKGFVDVKPFTPERCVYIAGYVQKKLFENSELQKDIYKFKVREFLRCSQHLGEQYILDHISDYDDEHCYLVQNGYIKSMPRQFRKLLIRLGVISEQSQITMALRQEYERDLLIKDCKLKNVELSDFFRNRIEIAKHNAFRVNARRMKTGDI